MMVRFAQEPVKETVRPEATVRTIYSQEGDLCGFIKGEDVAVYNAHKETAPPPSIYKQPLLGIVFDTQVGHLVKEEVVGTTSSFTRS